MGPTWGTTWGTTWARPREGTTDGRGARRRRARPEHRMHGTRPSQDGDVGLSRLRVHVLRLADRHVPRLQGQEHQRAGAPRDPEPPANLAHRLRPADVLAP